MNLDKFINILLIQLNEQYDLSLIEIVQPKKINSKVFLSRTYNFNYREKGTSPKCNERYSFYNKRDLLKFLQCLAKS